MRPYICYQAPILSVYVGSTQHLVMSVGYRLAVCCWKFVFCIVTQLSDLGLTTLALLWGYTDGTVQ